MLIKVINPNTSTSMTESIAKSARAVAGRDTTVSVVTNGHGPASIESHYDEALSVPGVLAEIRSGERDGVDGYVIACFGDPALLAAREVARGPVVGIAEAAVRTAGYLGRGFSVLTTLRRCEGATWDLVRRYGVDGLCRGVHGCGVAVLDLDGGPEVVAGLIEAGRRAVREDGADVLVLGCAGMTDLCGELAGAVGVPVVDGVQAGVLAVESLVRMGLRTSEVGEFAVPPVKGYSGMVAGFGRS